MQVRRHGRWPCLVVLASAWVGGGGLALAGPHLLAMPALLAAAGVALLLSLRDRRATVLLLAALGAVIVVAVSPLALITASFWLSFGAVSAFAYGLASARQGWGLLRAQFAVSLAIVPLTIAFFGQRSLVGPFANCSRSRW